MQTSKYKTSNLRSIENEVNIPPFFSSFPLSSWCACIVCNRVRVLIGDPNDERGIQLHLILPVQNQPTTPLFYVGWD